MVSVCGNAAPDHADATAARLYVAPDLRRYLSPRSMTRYLYVTHLDPRAGVMSTA